MSGFIDLTGRRFGKLIVIYRIENDKYHNAQWLCKCDCSNETIVPSNRLKSKNTRSCGCLRTFHNYRCRNINNKTYITWKNMIQRCYYTKHHRYKNYGGRGIKVCKQWLKPKGQGFLSFLKDMGEKPEGLTLDRIDNNSNYCLENCRWDTYETQSRNTSKNILITINSRTMCLKDWCVELNINYKTMHKKIRRGASPKDVIKRYM